jgi:hypothetical protein
MKFLLFLTAFLAGAAHAQTPQPNSTNWRLAPFGSTEKLLASQSGRLDAWKPVPVQLDCVRGEHLSFQFVISAGDAPIESLSVAPTPLSTFDARFIESSNFEFFRENFVHVQKPSGNRIQTPKWWPDALVPLALAPQKIEPNQSAVFWTTLRIPADTAPGDYFGELDVVCNNQPKRLALAIHVRAFQLPRSNFRATVALYYDALRDWYQKNGNTFSDKDWAAQKQRYVNFLLDFGLNPYDPPIAWNENSIDDYLKNPRVHSVRTPPLDSPDFPFAIEALKRTQTTTKAFYYWNDEPQTKQQFEAIKANSPKLRALGISQLVTHHPTPELSASVDIWCPNIANALGSGHLDIAQLQAEQKKGHPTWLYTMIVPKHPYPTWLLDDDSSAILSYAPLWSKVGASGFVYSMAHGWGPKPLENLESFQNTNGDGTLIYPAELVGGSGPMPSIRLMLLRDAIEDVGLWNEATRRKIAPPFEFPASRSGALVYDRKALLDALQTGKSAPVKAANAPGLWALKPTTTTFGLPFERALGSRHRVVLSRFQNELKIELRGPKLARDEELVLLMAPLDVERGAVQTRFLLNSKDEIEVSQRNNSAQQEQPTREGGFRIVAANSFAVKALLPVRFNILIRSPNGTTRLFRDGNDPFSMPILQLP